MAQNVAKVTAVIVLVGEQELRVQHTGDGGRGDGLADEHLRRGHIEGARGILQQRAVVAARHAAAPAAHRAAEADVRYALAEEKRRRAGKVAVK